MSFEADLGFGVFESIVDLYCGFQPSLEGFFLLEASYGRPLSAEE